MDSFDSAVHEVQQSKASPRRFRPWKATAQGVSEISIWENGLDSRPELSQGILMSRHAMTLGSKTQTLIERWSFELMRTDCGIKGCVQNVAQKVSKVTVQSISGHSFSPPPTTDKTWMSHTTHDI